MKDTHTMVLTVLGAVVIGTVGFFAGRHTNAGFGGGWAMGNQQERSNVGFGRPPPPTPPRPHAT